MSSNTNNFMPYIRKACHAGSWYSDDEKTLDQELAGYLSDVVMNSSTIEAGLRGIVCPHAGYSYSGPTAAYSYSALCQELSKKDSPIRTILVLHPSHHLYLEGCAVSGAHTIETPVGKLTVNETLRQEILALGDFTYMEQGVDEAEHSGEMQYPYIAKVLKDTQKTDSISVLPIMCGNLSTSMEAFYGKLLAPIMVRPEVLCVISTDFCHWGTRFRYQPTSQDNTMPIHEFIQQLDQQGMQHISMQEPGAFARYLQETRNTICGRHAAQVWLHGVTYNKDKEVLEIEFVKYAQSSRAKSLQDSSVSYASAVARRR
jgi:AmmeMemoRadiSam system protein B